MRYLILSLLLTVSPALSWGGCEKREYSDRQNERAFESQDRSGERETWNKVFNKMSESTQCITTEKLIIQHAELKYRKAEFERTKKAGINSWLREAKREYNYQIKKCFIESNNSIEFDGCLESLGI